MSTGGLTRFFADRVSLMRASEIRELLKLTENKEVISFAGGLPDPATFPKEELAEMAIRVLRTYGDQALQYSPTKGITPLRSELASLLSGRGIRVTGDEDIMVTTGSQEALHIIAQTLIGSGDYVVVELPSFLGAINAFRICNPSFIGIPLDDDGMRVDVLELRLKRLYNEGRGVKLLYTIPIAHNPAGVTMSLERRKHLMELAVKYDFVIVEDDPYSAFVYEPTDTTPLKALDRDGRVIYISTFSKILAPGLRLGWIVSNREFVEVFERCKQSVDLHTSTFNQFLALESIKAGIIEKTVNKARRIYKRKKDLMLEALDEYMIPGSWWSKPHGGLFVMVRLPREDFDTSKILLEAINAGVAYVPGGSFFVDGSGANTMRLNFSFPREDQIAVGVKILSEVVKRRIQP